MPAWKPIVGLSFDADGFATYCHALHWQGWRPKFVVLHNSGVPSLAQRPKGFSKAHINGLVTFYRDTNKWNAGPHLFIDDHQIWVFTPLTMPGVHSPSWNHESIGVEMLGDYEVERFDEGRGEKVRDNAVAAIATLTTCLGINPDTMKLHAQDDLTTHVCPGRNVDRDAFVVAVRARIEAEKREHALDDAHPD